MLLTCGNAGSILPATWAAITDGSVGMSIGTANYNLSDLDFSACTNMDQVALVVQTALRQERDDNVGIIRWYSHPSTPTVGHFKFWLDSASGATSYLTAGSTGTDISGPSYMNGLTGGTATIAPILEISAIIRPHQTVTSFPGWIMDRFSDMIIARAIWQLKTMPGPFRDPVLAGMWDIEFKIQIAKTIGETSRNYKARSRGMRA
jgi:hypothetical protein